MVLQSAAILARIFFYEKVSQSIDYKASWEKSVLTDFLLLKMFSIAFHISLYFSHRSSIPIKEDMVLALSKCLTYPFIRGVKMHNEYFHCIIVLFTWIPSFEKWKFCFSVSISQNLKKSLSKFEIILGRPYLFNPTKICLGFLHLTLQVFFTIVLFKYFS